MSVPCYHAVILYAVFAWHIGSEVVGTFLAHVPSIPRDMFLVNFSTLRVFSALRDYLRGRFVFADLLPHEISDFQRFLRHSNSPVSVPTSCRDLNQIQ